MRLEGTGEKLYMALKLTGLAWGTRLEAEQFTRSRRWLDCGLPRSVNTVIEDIRSGIAAERLDRYLAYFQMPAELFLDAAVGAYSPEFSCGVLKSRHQSRAVSPLDPRQDSVIFEHLNRQNDKQYLHDLVQVLGGVYDLAVRYKHSDVWLLGAAIIGEPTEGGLQAAGCLAVDEVSLDFHARLFRWHNYLHVHYASNDNQLLGYMMTPDPLQSILIRHRRPFYMKLDTLSGNLIPSPEPDRATIYALRQEPEGSGSMSEAYNALREAVVSQPLLTPDQPRYEAIKEILVREKVL
ncbi:hypothetical protein NY78_3592 [Desulfovibrio sp. TomC]|nr:hypothetical protein NY78_3592 [Desulfovibrio sp. TomC]